MNNSQSSHAGGSGRSLKGIEQILLLLAGGYAISTLSLAAPEAIDLLTKHPSSLFATCLLALSVLVAGTVLATPVSLPLSKSLGRAASLLFLFTLLAWNMNWLGIEDLGEPRTWTWGFTGTGIGLAAASMRGRWPWVHGGVTALIVLFVPLMPGGANRPWVLSWQDALLAITLTVVVSEPFLALKRSAARTDQAHEILNLRYESAATQRAIDSERYKMERLLHDKVLDILRVAAERTTSPESLQARAKAAGKAIESAFTFNPNDEPTETAELFSSLVLESSEFEVIPIKSADFRPDLRISRRQYEALLGATMEAVRNSRKHAKGSHVSLLVATPDQSVEVSIEDTGPGFNTTSSFPDQFGLQHSIIEPCEAANVEASIQSRQGKGTRITLITKPSDRRYEQ
ncbi:sensor histidine kinase [Glutamicibacter sp. NPDC087344]|uniref:sensor histidine kinase n=1 Tax=Glutamicibacter sp. NPDC087344 TaxID=3363994 RepID=UPI0038136CBC